MTREMRNPANFLSLLPLLPAEKKFARCLAEGEFCIIGNGELPKMEIESGEGANVVRSEVIRFFAYGGNEKKPVLGSEIYLHGAWISGDLDLIHASIPYALIFGSCHFDASVIVLHTECAALYLNESCLAKGLSADGLTTKGDVNLRDGFSAKEEVRLLGANIGGSLNCDGGKFHNPSGRALSADGLVTKGDVNLRDGFSAKGEVRLQNASIGGDVNCDGGKFHNPDGNALFADDMMTKGSVILRGDFSAKGRVQLQSANIGRDLNCVNGKFHNLDGEALFADGLTTKGSVILRGDFSVKGEVRLLGANIGGDLNCEGGKFHNPGGRVLSADGLTTKGSVLFRYGFSAKGEVRLLGANIGGNLNCVFGEFHNSDKNKYALNVDGGNISGGLFWRATTCKGNVSLAYAKASGLADEPDSWKSCKVDLEGFIYNRFVSPINFQSCIDWLDNRPDKMGFSSLPYEQAAKVLFGMGHAHDAREILLEKERRQTKYEKMHLLRRVRRQLWDVFAGYGYRLSYTAAWMLGIVVVGTVIFDIADRYGNIVPAHPVIALSEDYRGKIASNGNSRPTQAVKPEYPAFNPLMFSLDVFTPSAVFHQEDSWGPRAGEGAWWVALLFSLVFLCAVLAFCFPWFLAIAQMPRSGILARRWVLLCGGFAGAGVIVVILGIKFSQTEYLNILWLLTLWYWLEVAMGWILTSMLLLSVTGLLRPRQSYGEKD